MSKELPYFQFEPAEYLTKDISFCSLPAQGMFINICSYYWQRGCEMTKQQILRRLNHEDYFNELVEEGIIYLDGDHITISFLKEQYDSLQDKKNDSSVKGQIGNLKRWNEDIYKEFKVGKITLEEALEIAKSSGGDKLAIAETSEKRREEKKEEKKIEDEGEKNIFDIDVDGIRVFDLDGIYKVSELAENYLKETQIVNAVIKNEDNGFKDVEHLTEMMKLFQAELIEKGETVKQCRDFRTHFRNWHKIKVKVQKSNEAKQVKKQGTKYSGII